MSTLHGGSAGTVVSDSPSSVVDDEHIDAIVEIQLLRNRDELCQGQRSQPCTRHQIQTGPKHISREQRKQEILQ
jgi:hypothetical protein